jgi:hypothetical protein
MAGECILFVCFDPALLMPRERPLLAQGYEVRTVFGLDGLMSAEHIPDFDFILIGDEGPLKNRRTAIRWLKKESPLSPVIALCPRVEHLPGADFQVSTADPEAWLDEVADHIERHRGSA